MITLMWILLIWGLMSLLTYKPILYFLRKEEIELVTFTYEVMAKLISFIPLINIWFSFEGLRSYVRQKIIDNKNKKYE